MGNLEEFLSQAAKGGGLAATLGEYYSYRVIAFFDRTSGILTLIAAMFTLAWFQRHNEMTAAQAAGISKGRIVRPIIYAVASVSLVAAVSRELVIPQFRDKFSRNAQDLGAEATRKLDPRYDSQTAFDQRPPTADKPGANCQSRGSGYRRSLHTTTGMSPAVLQRMCPPARDSPPDTCLTTSASRGSRQAFAWLKRHPVLLSPSDTPWLTPNQCFLVSDVEFDQLVDATSWRQYSSTWDLIAGLYNRSLDFGSDVRVTVHSRIVQPVLDLTLLFLGMPLSCGAESKRVCGDRLVHIRGDCLFARGDGLPVPGHKHARGSGDCGVGAFVYLRAAGGVACGAGM